MTRFHLAIVVTGLLVSALSFGAHGAGPGHWSYDGDTGPAQWADLHPDNHLCMAGLQQSPISLGKSDSTRPGESDFAIGYGIAKGQLVNNGHTIQFNLSSSAGNRVTLQTGTYALAQFHFHTPSEHHLDGESYPMEMHLVNKDAAGKITVVGVLIEEGTKNETLGTLWQALPAPDATTPEMEIDVAALLPKSHDALHYAGSLTTPPCSEEVNWIVLEHPIEMSRQQIDAFKTLFRDNRRPIQPTNGRKVSQ